MSRPKRKSDLLTTVELEFMMVLWRIGHGTVREVLDILNEREKRAYTSVATMLKILVDKGYLSSVKQDRTFVYSPNIDKEEYERLTLNSISNTLFDGTPTALVARLVDDENISEETIDEIRKIIDTRFRR
jgi:predicted transcriptional regulator